MVGTIVSAQAEEDLRHAILKNLNDADLMNACLVSKGAYTATSSLQALVCRLKAANETLRKSHIRNEEMQAEYLNSIEPDDEMQAEYNLNTIILVREVEVLTDIADHRQAMHNKYINVHTLLGSVNAWSHLSFRWAAEKKVTEMAAVIEKQAFQIEALKRLYKAK